jgi:hypothetical protein
MQGQARPARLEADGEHAFVLRCRSCAREEHRCEGRPDGIWPAVCRCPQCWLDLAECEWDAARFRQDSQAAWRLRIWGDVMRAARVEARTRKRPKQGPWRGTCAECGHVVTMLYRAGPGRPVYCRFVTTPDGRIIPGPDGRPQPTAMCRMRAYRRRLAQAAREAGLDGAIGSQPERRAEASGDSRVEDRFMPAQGHPDGDPDPRPAWSAAAAPAWDAAQWWLAVHGR